MHTVTSTTADAVTYRVTGSVWANGQQVTVDRTCTVTKAANTCATA